MKKTKSIIWGLIIIALGVFWGLKEANLIDFSIFFDGWWTLFIIIPCFIGLFKSDNKPLSATGLIVGILLLVNCYYDIWQYKAYLFPALVVIAGISIVITNIFPKKKDIPQIQQDNYTAYQETPVQQSNAEYYASFSGENYRFDNGFAGGKFVASFGGIKVDIRNADIVNNCVITTNATFGGVDIYVPNDVRVVVKSNSLFGGTTDRSNKNLPADVKTVYVVATNLFGGTEIK
mgnify:CR=1 FL=1